MPKPPDNLVKLLERLQIATPSQLASVAARVKKLAGDLPDFESVWVDALAQQRVLSPWQAAEINAGRGQEFQWGDYVVCGPLASPHHAECYLARNPGTHEAVRLYVAHTYQRPLGVTTAAMKELVARSALAPMSQLTIRAFGTRGKSIWAATALAEGKTIGQWLLENGRLPPLVVLHLAREMASQLAEWEAHGITHGDLGAASLLVDKSGEISLPAPGLRGVLRPYEGYSFGDLRPEAYDYLAPERIENGTPPDTASDVYGCGCLWWQLLTGRAPFPGGNSPSKLKAVHAGRYVDVRPLVPTISPHFAEAIAACRELNPANRPRSFAELADRLGSPTANGKRLLADLMQSQAGAWSNLRRPKARPRRSSHRSKVIAVGGVVALLAGIALIPLALRNRKSNHPPEITAAVDAQVVQPPTGIAEAATNGAEIQRRDFEVKPASMKEPVIEPLIEDLVLATDAILRVAQLDLQAHTRVRGRGGKRATISVPAQGLVVAFEDVTFENIDFIWELRPLLAGGESPSPLTILDARCQIINFRGCSFSTDSAQPPVAMRYSGGSAALPGLGGEVTFTNCVFDGVSAVVDSHVSTGLSVELHNCLCVAAGPLLRFARPPQSSDMISLLLDHVTTRGDTRVLECRYGRLAGEPGALQITANGSALAGTARGGLLSLQGSHSPEQLMRAIHWTGQGSIVTPQTPIVVWHDEQDKLRTLSEESVDIAGLVRGELQFAGRADGPSAASLVTHWQVPLRSPDPPGADPALLASPRDR